MDKAQVVEKIRDLEQANVQMQANITQMQANMYANQGAIQMCREFLAEAGPTDNVKSQEGNNE